MKNSFFKIALAQAIRMAGKPDRILHLVSQLILRLSLIDRKNISTIELKQRLNILGRLVAAYARGRYRIVPMKTLLIILAAVLYFLNPFDLVPDAILGFGFVDDLAVLTWVYQSAQKEIIKFMHWDTLGKLEITI